MEDITTLPYSGTIEINATDYPYLSSTITLAEIRHLGNIPENHKVYEEIPEPRDDPQVQEGEIIEVHHQRKFYSVSPSITGGTR